MKEELLKIQWKIMDASQTLKDNPEYREEQFKKNVDQILALFVKTVEEAEPEQVSSYEIMGDDYDIEDKAFYKGMANGISKYASSLISAIEGEKK